MTTPHKKTKKTALKTKSAPVQNILKSLDLLYPNASCELIWHNPLQLLIAVILSAQCTDKRVNMVTPALFLRFKTAADFAFADRKELETLIQSTGFYRNKAKHIQESCLIIHTRFKDRVPDCMDDLLTLPGVARKTANVVLGTAFMQSCGFVVDTHIKRLALRLGLSTHATPEKVEQDLMCVIPKERWISLGHQLIWHGRRVCFARNPQCQACTLNTYCFFYSCSKKKM